MPIRILSRMLGRAPGLATVAMLGAIVSAIASDPIPVAIVDFDYADSSGELRDQTSEHAKRLADFVKTLRDDLAATGRFKPVMIACASPPCTGRNTPAAALIEAAKAAGARLLVYGGIEKMSTLIQWGKLEIVDLQANRLIDDKMLTFRGDNDEAWRRAAAFAIDEIKGLDVRK
jgi:Protein of unknown function (DUF2380)